MYVVKQKSAVFSICYVLLGALGLVCASIIHVPFLSAQNSQYKDYNHTGKPENTEGKAQDIVAENIDRAFDKINDFVNEHGDKISEIPKEKGTEEDRYGHKSPEKHPLEKNNSDGKLDNNKSWHEYQRDSLIILERETFPICLEPRMVARKNNLALNSMNPILAGVCAAKCPYLPWLDLHNEDWMVVSYYWPETVISVNKAGAQMIDPAIINQKEGQELYRRRTSIKEDQEDNERNYRKQRELLEAMDIKMKDYKNPEYRKAGDEFHLRQQQEVRYPRAMRPNAFWRAADARTVTEAGWKKNESCLFDALDPPTGKKKVLRNNFDQTRYAVLARYPELRQRTDRERYRYTSPEKVKITEYRNDKNLELDTPCASWRMGSNRQVYGDLEKIGVQSKSGNKYKEYCLPGKGELSGSMVHHKGYPRLQADAVRAAMAAIWFSSDSGQIGDLNDDEHRLSKFSFYKNRDSSSRSRYVNTATNPSENKSNIVFADKMQRIYPTQPKGGNADGKGGASSENYRTTSGQRGSHCFRPEDIPNWSSEDEVTKSEWPLGLALDSSQHFGETRWAIWNQRIFCACDDKAWFGTGCQTFNTGDHDEVHFAGILIRDQVPKPLENGIKITKDYATKRGKPEEKTKQGSDLDMNWATLDTGEAGYTNPKIDLTPEKDPDFVGEPPKPGVLICKPVTDAKGDENKEDESEEPDNDQENPPPKKPEPPPEFPTINCVTNPLTGNQT